MTQHLYYFRPGEEARMLARCQFGLDRNGRGGAILTYPIQGYPWRRNPTRTIDLEITADDAGELFREITTIRETFPTDCLTDNLWSDSAEKANGITRDIATNTLCYTIGIYDNDGQPSEYYSLREDSDVLLNSNIYRTVSGLVAGFETLDAATES